MTPIKNVLCPVDCSEGSKVALDYAVYVGKHFGATVHLLHGWIVAHHVRPDLSVWMEAHGQQPINEVIAQAAREETRQFVESLDEGARKLLTVHVLEGEPASLITDFAKQNHVDLIVMGTHGRTGLLHLALGSVAEKVVRLAECPVLTVRSSAKRH
ncbi:MAG TPA: universal stress protein [Polyangiaceae bacterium]|nr:universal stress protein [Polyangiaceae bacterium]